jgi:hypothetical protein
MTAGPNERAVFIDPPVNSSANNSPAKSVRPIPIGAKAVRRCFSAASMITANTSAAVMNISMNTACTLDVPTEGTVLEGFIRIGRGEVRNRRHSLDLEWTRKKGLKQRRRHDGTQELRDHIHEEPDWVDRANEEHREGYIGIEEATRDTVEEPHGNEEGESHRRGRVED